MYRALLLGSIYVEWAITGQYIAMDISIGLSGWLDLLSDGAKEV